MNQLIKSTTILALTVFLAASALAEQGRKLPVGSYITSAKIHIISGDLSRYPEAIAMLDSLAMHYGPHAEALHWMGQMMVDYAEKESSPMAKKPRIEQMVAYFDSLHSCCDNDDIKEKYRKNCKKYIAQADSIRVLKWREFYNLGVEQLTVMEGLGEELALAEDSTSRSYIEGIIKANMDSCVANMELAITLDPSNHQTYIGIGSAYEKGGEYQKALEWQEIGLAKAPDSLKPSMSLSIGYTYIGMDKYCEAIPYLNDYLADTASDVTWQYNLSICYNNCGFYDSALATYQAILELEPGHQKVLSGVGRYFNDVARRAADSAKYYSDLKDVAQEKVWQGEKDAAFDSARVYFKRAFENDATDEFVADMYALVSALGGKFDDAAVAYTKLTELQPTNADNWTYLGDIRLRQNRLPEAISAYEKSVELNPSVAEIWQSLVDLYHDQGMAAKEAEAKKKLQALK